MVAASHRLIAISGAILLGANPFQVAAAGLGATLPDRIESIGLPHRGISHTPWPWAAAVWVMWSQQTQWGDLLAWWLAGALFHIGADLFTVGGIPLITLGWKIRLGSLRTGGTGEYLVVVTMVVVALVQVLGLTVIKS